MRTTVPAMAVLGPGHAVRSDVVTLDLRGVRAVVGLTEVPPPILDREDPVHASSVLVRVRAFSTNYRDRWLMRKAATAVRDDQVWVLGSEFAGEVVEVGPEVAEVRPGQRVMGNNHWSGRPMEEDPRSRVGIPTNNASRQYLLLPKHQLHPVPEGMGWADAAAFSIGAQTAVSMARKAFETPGARVIVTAGRSSTSLFATRALLARGARVTVITSSGEDPVALAAPGVERVVVWPRGEDRAPLELRESAPFQAVVDPFFDVYASRVLPLLEPGIGVYVWCGMTDDVLPGTSGADRMAETATRAMTTAMLQNLRLVGNCIGRTEDLVEGVRLWREGRLPVPLDSVFPDGEARAFVERTFRDPGRVGKTALQYGDT